MDNSDNQYAGFRDNIPYMFLLVLLHPLLRRILDSILPAKSSDSSLVAVGEARFQRRISYDVYFAFVFLLALHGSSAFKVLAILYTNYSLAKTLPKPYVPIATWTFNIGILFANELCHGYPYSSIARIIAPFDDQADKSNWGTVLDSYGGLIPRWEILFNITILRLISFNMDYYWSLGRDNSSSIEVCTFSDN